MLDLALSIILGLLTGPLMLLTAIAVKLDSSGPALYVQELVGENAFDYVHPEDVGRVRRTFAEGLADPTLRLSAQYRFRHKDGSWRYLESVGSNLLHETHLESNDTERVRLARRSVYFGTRVRF